MQPPTDGSEGSARTLLSICVPTYNRVEEFARRVSEFLGPVVTRFPGQVEVIVGDNSDDEWAARNHAACPAGVQYLKNNGNLGYSGNVSKLCELASGRYLWVVSDNDRLRFEHFEELLAVIVQAEQLGCKGVSVDYTIQTPGGFVTERGPGGSMQEPIELSKLREWQSRRLPFTLVSSVIVWNDRGKISWASRSVGDNDYIQVALFAAAITAQGKIVASGLPIIGYENERLNQFGLKSLYISLLVVGRFCDRKLSIKVRDVDEADYLSFLIARRRGKYEISNSDEDSRWFLRRLAVSRSAATGLRIFSLKMPAPLFNLLSRLMRLVRRR